MSTAPIDSIISPRRLWSRDEILTHPCPISGEPGVYGWYFSTVPPTVPIDGCHVLNSMPLLYVGISPKPPPANGGKASQQNIRKRLRYHYRGNAAGSTLRLTLGCLLEKELGIQLRVAGPSGRMTFGEGEARLSEWMGSHTQVAWVACASPWVVEERLISTLSLPLNLDQNGKHAFCKQLGSVRRAAKQRAREAAVLQLVSNKSSDVTAD